MTALQRKDIDDLTADELKVYVHAVGKLMDDGVYATHAAFHNVFSNNPPLGCEHANDLFFPWHRFHLLNFERALQLSDPDHPSLSTKNVTIPYWNWGVAPRTGVRYPAALEDPTSRLFSDERNPDPSGPAFPAETLKKLIRGTTDWNVFAGGPKDVNESYGVIESPAHNRMHDTFIEGLMGHPSTAAKDPIYWSFHAFLDRVWEQWFRIHGGALTCNSCTLRSFPTAPTAGEVERTDATVALGNGVTSLGYFYEFTAEEVEPLPSPDFADDHALFMAGIAAPLRQQETLHELARAGTSTTFEVPALSEVPNRAVIWLRHLVRPTRSFRVAVFLHPSEISSDAVTSAANRQYYVGEFNFWKAHHVVPGQTCGAPLTATEAFRSHTGKQGPHLLTLVPIALAEKGGAAHHGDHDGHGHAEQGALEFGGVVLQVNGNGLPNIPLGEAHG